jgi:hypothetical protein
MENWEILWKERKSIVLNVFIYFKSKIPLKNRSLITDKTAKAQVYLECFSFCTWDTCNELSGQLCISFSLREINYYVSALARTFVSSHH